VPLRWRTAGNRISQEVDAVPSMRRLYQTGPDRYEYALTRKGTDIILVIQALAQVGDKWKIAAEVGPPLKFINKHSGRPLKVALVDEKSGEVVLLRDNRPQAGPGADDLVRWRLTKFGM